MPPTLAAKEEGKRTIVEIMSETGLAGVMPVSIVSAKRRTKSSSACVARQHTRQGETGGAHVAVAWTRECRAHLRHQNPAKVDDEAASERV